MHFLFPILENSRVIVGAKYVVTENQKKSYIIVQVALADDILVPTWTVYRLKVIRIYYDYGFALESK